MVVYPITTTVAHASSFIYSVYCSRLVEKKKEKKRKKETGQLARVIVEAGGGGGKEEKKERVLEREGREPANSDWLIRQ